ncbi:MAG: hypothetical protein OEV49_10730 [candidate division Zixibacteria bacterium]|nr:hypothetical protein [candidate division Zixibacteria bacterium]
MEIIFSTKKYRNKVPKSPKIQTNEGGTDKMVRISTTVTERPDSTYPVINTPYKLDMSQFTGKQVIEKRLKIANVSDEDLDITLVAFAHEYFVVSLPESVGAGETVEGEVVLRDDVLEKSFEKSFTFELSDENHSRFTIPVKRTVRNVGAGTRAAGDKGK